MRDVRQHPRFVVPIQGAPARGCTFCLDPGHICVDCERHLARELRPARRNIPVMDQAEPVVLVNEPLPLGWSEQAACRDMPVDIFYPPFTKGWHRPDPAELQAKKVCQGCPVRSQCLDEAIAMADPDGIRGGMNPRERADEAERRKQRAVA